MSTETIVLYPAPGSGHMVPMVELGKLFVRHYSHKFSVTILYPTGCFLDSPSIASYIHQTNQSHPSISFRPLPPPAAKIDYPSETRSGATVLFNFIRQNDANVRLALKEIMSSLVIRAFVIDVFCTSALPIAQELNIPTFYFHISGAAALALFLYIPTIHAKVSQSFKDMKDTIFQIPGVEAPLRAVHMPDAILDRNDPAYSDFVYFCSHLPKSSGIIVNTFEENEADVAFQAISQGLCVPDAPTPPFHYFGPLIAQELKKSSEDECLLWLDKQPSRSVVYVCSGSRGSYSVTQLREIANGLERSGQRFLWVVKKPPTGDRKIHSGDDFDLTSLLPEGFLRKTEDKGMVVKSWAPQVAVLNKEAVGGFVTHCGWNSVLESVVAGVAMVAWPMEAEQYFNRNFMVKDMKMAIDVKQREEDGFVSGEEVERAIRELMESKQGRMLRDRSLKLKEIALGALGDNGSSKRALINFVNGIN